MGIEFRLPELGENVPAGTVGKLLVAVGDTITAGQNVLEIETDKAVAEIPCDVAGKVVEIRAVEGEKINVGDIVLILEAVAESEKPAKEAPPPTAAPQTEKKAATPAQPVAAAQAPKPATQAQARPGLVRAAPSVRRLAREHDVDLNEVPIADPSGKATAQDILAFVAARESGTTVSASAPVSAAATPMPAPSAGAEEQHLASDRWGTIVQEAMNTIRIRTAERLSESWQTIPHVTHFDKADVTALESLRKQAARKAEAKGARLTTMAFVLKAVPEVLKRFPRFNASVDMETQQLLLKQYYHIGFAVDTPNGLVVPVLRDADQKTVLEIALEMAALAEKARDRKLTLEDMQGGTFTISNLGGLGGTAFTPIINAPETAILGLSRTQTEPVYNGNEFEPRQLLPLNLSYDHRIIDGADAARFLRFLAVSIEQPWHLFLGF